MFELVNQAKARLLGGAVAIAIAIGAGAAAGALPTSIGDQAANCTGISALGPGCITHVQDTPTPVPTAAPSTPTPVPGMSVNLAGGPTTLYASRNGWSGAGGFLPVGSSIADLAAHGFDNRTMAVQTAPGQRLALYDDKGFNGACTLVPENTRVNLVEDLGNPTKSSAVFGSTALQCAGVVLYKGADFTGDALHVTANAPNLEALGYGDSVVSLVDGQPGTKVALFSGRDYQGDCAVVTASTANLGTLPVGGRISSLKIGAECPSPVVSEKVTGKVAAVSWAAGRKDLFARSPEGQLWHRWYDGGQWHGPELLGGNVVGSPAAASWGQGRLDVFYRGTDNALYQIWYQNGWFGPQKLTEANMLNSDPAAVSWGPNRIDVFAKGNPDGMLHVYWDGTGWKTDPATFLGGVVVGNPTVASWGPGRLDVFHRSSDKNLWQKTYDPENGWRGWYKLSVGEWVSSDPAAVSTGLNRITVYVNGQRNVTHCVVWWDGAKWNGDGGWDSNTCWRTDYPPQHFSAASPAPGVVDVYSSHPDWPEIYQRVWRESYVPIWRTVL